MKNSLSSELIARFPSYVRFFLVARDIDNQSHHEELERLLNEAARNVRKDPALKKPIEHSRIANWRRAFEKLGIDPDEAAPSVQALVMRARERGAKKDESIFAYHNTIVALSNYISLKHLIPSGVDDLGLVQGDFGLRFAKGTELFVGFNDNKVERPNPGEVIFADQRKVMCRRWVWQQGVHTMVTSNSRDVAVNLDILPPVTRKQGEKIAAEFAELIRHFCGGDVTLYTLDREDSIAEFETPPSTREETVYDTLELRGYIKQTNNRDRVRTLLNEGTTVYQGFDPTKPSLHVGHLMSLMVFNYLQNAGNSMIFILGGGTAQVGDPSMRSEARKMLTTEEVERNAVAVKAQVQGMGLANFDQAKGTGDEQAAIMLDNVQWLKMDLLEFAREITPHFNVVQMFKREDFKKRVELKEPLSLFEFIYTALQGFDYLYLHDRYDCRIQMGGDDQWINILDGVELIRSKHVEAKTKKENGVELTEVERNRLNKKGGGAAYAMTFPLLMDRTGQKMGKTSAGQTIWLAAEGEYSTLPFEFYQYWVNCPDEDLERNFKLFTFLSLEEIDQILAGHPREAQHRLAYEVTKIVHGEETARRLQEDAHRAFKGAGLPTEVPTVTISREEAETGMSLATLLTKVGLGSRSEARRRIEGGGVTLNEVRLSKDDMNRLIRLDDLRDFDGQKAAIVTFGKGKAAKIVLS